MGICASCLGLNRHPSQDIDETDPLLDDQQVQYGGVGGTDVTAPDEEELRQEREMLEHIAGDATDNMIDVLHRSNAVVSQQSTSGEQPAEPLQNDADDADEDEAAWLKGVQASGAEDLTLVKGLQTGSLIVDMSSLREEAPMNTGQRSLKGKLPA